MLWREKGKSLYILQNDNTHRTYLLPSLQVNSPQVDLHNHYDFAIAEENVSQL